MDRGLNELLKWSVENSEASRQPRDPSDPSSVPPPTQLNEEALRALMGGPSEADLMKESMAALLSDEVDLENKMVAFDNFEQLVETIDNANNMEPLGLWTPLVGLLSHKEADMRRMAAWCVGTAVQNNEKAQDKVCHLFIQSAGDVSDVLTLSLNIVACHERSPYSSISCDNRLRQQSSPQSRLRPFICRPQLPAQLE